MFVTHEMQILEILFLQQGRKYWLNKDVYSNVFKSMNILEPYSLIFLIY